MDFVVHCSYTYTYKANVTMTNPVHTVRQTSFTRSFYLDLFYLLDKILHAGEDQVLY